MATRTKLEELNDKYGVREKEPAAPLDKPVREPAPLPAAPVQPVAPAPANNPGAVDVGRMKEVLAETAAPAPRTKEPIQPAWAAQSDSLDSLNQKYGVDPNYKPTVLDDIMNFSRRTGLRFDRLINMVRGAAEGTAQGYVGAARFLHDAQGQVYAGQQRNIAQYLEDTGSPGAEFMRANADQFLADRANETAKLAATSDRLADLSAQHIEQAKDGFNGIERLVVDAGVAGTQMLGDAAGNLIMPGGGLALMGIRSFGSASEDARRKGADLGRQFAYALPVAATEVLTEMMFDGLAGAFGKGAADDYVEALIAKAVKSEPLQAALRVLYSAGGEAFEEAVSGIIDPLLQNIIDGRQGEGFRRNLTPEAFADLGYSALVGGILGAAGGSVDIIKNPDLNAKVATRQAQEAAEQQMVADARNAYAQAQIAAQIRKNTTYAENAVQRDAGASNATQPTDTLAQVIMDIQRSGAEKATKAQVEAVMNDEASMQRLGVEPATAENGKTTSQVQGEVRDALAQAIVESQQNAAPVNANAEQGAGVTTSATPAAPPTASANTGFHDSTGAVGKSASAILDKLAKMTRTSIEIDPNVDDVVNGQIIGNRIILQKASDLELIKTGKHEITHRLQELSPEAYTTYRDYAVNALAEKGDVDALIARYQETYKQVGQNLTTDQAKDEIAADFTEALVTEAEKGSTESFEKLAAHDAKAAKGFVQAIRDFIAKVKALFSGKKAEQDEVSRVTFGVELDKLEQAAKLWDDLLNKGGEAAQELDVDTTENAASASEETTANAESEETKATETTETTETTESTKAEQAKRNKRYSHKVNLGTFFSGGGLVDYALRKVAESTMAVELDEKAAAVFELNNGKVFNGDVRDFSKQYLDDMRGKVDYFHASPVCKNYSRMNIRRNIKADNSVDITTAKATADAIGKLMPQVFTLEQVPGYQGSAALKIITDKLDALGYKVDSTIAKASDYGGATSRERLMLRAVKDGDLPPRPEKSSGYSWYEATSDLIDKLPEAELSNHLKEKINITQDLRDAMKNANNPILILGGTPGGKVWWVSSNQPCPSITTKMDEARVLMPDGRVLRATPRFFARIMGLPDSYQFTQWRGRDNQTTAYKVIGNGVPVQLTQAFFGNLLDAKLDTGVRYSPGLDESVSGVEAEAKLDREIPSKIPVSELEAESDMPNDEAFKDSAVQVRYSIRPPYKDGSVQFNEFADSLDKDARSTFDLFHNFYETSRVTNATGASGRKVKSVNISSVFMRVNEWNDMLKKDAKWAEAAQNLADIIPESVRKEMRMNDDGTLNPTPLEEEFKMEKSLAQRLVDALPFEAIDATYKLGDKTITLPTGKARQSVGGESYRRAILNETRKLYKEGKLSQVRMGTMSKDRWGSLGFLATNNKTTASGDFTTVCPQMMFNKGCWYCYRRAAMESGVNNKLVAMNVWYTGEILRIKNSDIEALNRNGGLRIQSFGDWMPHFSAQLADVLYDAELRGLQVKIITKEPSMINYIASLRDQGIGKNLYFNLSADYTLEKGPTGNGELAKVNPERPYLRDQDNEFWWKRAMTVEEAEKYRKKYPWVNTRIVATDIDEFIRGLKDDRVDVVTGYHGHVKQNKSLGFNNYERVDSETGEYKQIVMALGDAGMPVFSFNPKTGKWVTEFEGRTETHKALAAAIEREGLQSEYYTKVCCITGRCAQCNGKCGALARQFGVKNATNRDKQSVAYWQKHAKYAYEPEFGDLTVDDADGLARIVRRQFTKADAKAALKQGARDSLKNNPLAAFTAESVTPGPKNTSRLAQNAATKYTPERAKAAGMTRKQYEEMFKYRIRSEGESTSRAKGIVYDTSSGEKVFLKDADPAAYNNLVTVLSDAPAWNDIMVDTANLISKELETRSRNGEIPTSEYRQWLDNVREHATNTGRGTQAWAKWARLMRNVSTDGRLYMMERSLERIAKDLGRSVDMSISDELKDAYLNAADEDARNAVVEQIQKEAVAKLPASALEKWNALRYVNMLGNFKTQIRNVAGNVGMQALTKAKDKVAASIEGIASVLSGGKLERTKVLHANRALVKAATDYYNDSTNGIASAALGDSKYVEGRAKATDAFEKAVLDLRAKNTFGKANPLRYYQWATKWAMEAGDVIFNRPAFTHALAGWLQAHKVTADQFSNESWRESHADLVDRATNYAIKEAQEATFRDSNALSSWVSGIARGRNTPKAIKAAAEGVLPFRKTPANVFMRAYEYSPLGLIDTAVKAAGVKSGKASGADVVNSLSKALTGTALFGLGMWLKSLGLLRGGDDDDEAQEGFESMQGHQNYALEIPAKITVAGHEIEVPKALQNASFTLDWITPSAMPLFMGSEFYKLMKDRGLEVKDVERALTSLADPMIQMSMLQGVENTISDLKYGENSSFLQLGVSLALSYLTQGLTNTLLGQAKRTFEKTRKTTYTSQNSPLPNYVQRAIGKGSAKIPGVDYGQIDYIDEWGRTQDNPDTLTNAILQFLSPGYLSRINTTDVDKELQRLADNTDVGTGIFPDRPGKYITVNGENVYLSAEQYEAYAIEAGQTKLEVVRELINSNAYKNMSDEDKAYAIGRAYDYANQVAKDHTLAEYTPDKWVTNTQKAANDPRVKLNPAYVMSYKALLAQYKDDGMNTSSANAAARQVLMNDGNLTARQKEALDEIVFSDGIYLPKDLEVDYTDKESFTISQLTDSAQRHWPLVKDRFNIPYQDYAKIWSIRQNDDYTADEKRQMFTGMGYDGYALYKALGEKVS